MQEEIDSVKAELTKAKATVKDLQGLTGRKVAVTGALRGCGPAIVKRLLQEGAFVVAADRGMSDEQAQAAGLRTPAEGTASSPEADALEAGRLVFFDMGGPGDEAGASGLSSLCVESFGGMDGLVCNTSARSMLVGPGAGGASVANGGGGADGNNLLEHLEPTDWADALTGALTEPMLAVKHALPLLQAACAKGKVASGGIVNVVCTSPSSGSGGAGAGASGSSAEALSNRETLAAAAGGLAGLTHALAVSSGPYVRVNAVSVPEGSGRSAAAGSSGSGSGATTRAGRVGKDAASAVSFLLSSRAGSVTGQNLVVDESSSARKK